jgi:hypothetical protein
MMALRLQEDTVSQSAGPVPLLSASSWPGKERIGLASESAAIQITVTLNAAFRMKRRTKTQTKTPTTFFVTVVCI